MVVRRPGLIVLVDSLDDVLERVVVPQSDRRRLERATQHGVAVRENFVHRLAGEGPTGHVERTKPVARQAEGREPDVQLEGERLTRQTSQPPMMCKLVLMLRLVTRR